MAGIVTDRGRMVFALLLIAAGAVLLVLRLFGWSISDFLWPFFVIIPGIALLAVGLATAGPASHFPAVSGAIVTATGLILLAQSLSDYFQSWAYAWALLPAAAGGALMLVGGRDGDAGSAATGRRLAQWGILVFVVMGLVFEGLIFDSRWIDAELALPLILIAAGGVILTSWAKRKGRASIPPSGTGGGSGEPPARP